jgi:hypothetical protein
MATLTRDLTYAQLVAAIAAGELNEGEGIWITDYQTVHTIPNTSDTNTGEIEPLLVTAISNNELKPEAYSVAFPDDVIYYNPTNDQTMVPGCTKGYIYRRVDTKQSNDFPFDFRQVKFRRWQIDVPNWDNATEYSKMSVVKRPTGTAEEQLEVYISLVDSNTNNAVTNEAFWRRFEFDNLSYISPTANSWDRSDEYTFIIPCSALYQDYHFFADGDYYATCYSNKLASPNENLIKNTNTVIFGANFTYNSISTNFTSNSIGDNFTLNSIGAYFTHNSIGADFYSNNIGTNFYFNSIGANFYSNGIGDEFYSNIIGTDFTYNSIGAYFSYNSIGAYFSNNSISNNFNSNIIGANCISNSIGAEFSSNSIVGPFYFNSIGANFYSNIIGQ